MPERFFIKKDDTLPAIRAVLQDANATIVNLSGASVRFIMTNKQTPVGDTPDVDAPAVVFDAINGIVQYDWIETDTVTVGKYRAEWEVSFSGGGRETFPNDSYTEVVITGDLGGVA